MPITSMQNFSTDLPRDSVVDEERYERLEEYRRGGQKVIYKAYDISSERTVALAKIKDGANDYERELFYKEAKINAFLEHPNIIPVYDIGVLGKSPFFVMKFIEGQSLADVIAELDKNNEAFHQTYPIEKCLDIFKKVCEGIAYAHAQGIWHLDLKPSNIQLNHFGDVLICDWGLAGLSDQSENVSDERLSLEGLSIIPGDLDQLTVMGFAKGSPGYMAPEQTGQEGLRKSEATDIYALGAILYSILCYKAPYSGDLATVIQRTRKGDFVLPHKIKSTIPSALESICKKAMQVKPEGRYPCVEQLLADVIAYESNRMTLAEDPSITKMIELLFKRNLALSLCCLLGLFVIAILSLFYLSSLVVKTKKAEEAKELAEMRLNEFVEEKEDRKAISDVGVDFFIEIARDKMVLGHYEDTHRILTSLPDEIFSVEQRLDRDEILGKISFIAQKFHLASKYLNESKLLKELADEYTLKKASDDELLSGAELVELMQRLKNEDIYLVRDMYSFMSKNYQSIEDFFEVFKYMLYIENNFLKAFNLKLSHHQGQYHLDLSGNPQIKFLPSLPDLDIYHLRLSNLGVLLSPSIFSNQFSNLVELDIRDYSLKQYTFLRNLRKLKKIMVNSKSDYDKISKINLKGVEVVYFEK